MPRKKIDYGAMFTFDPKRNLYYAKRNGKKIYAKDPKVLYDKIQSIDAGEDIAPPTFKTVAEAWHDWKWEQISENTKQCYNAYYARLIDELGDIPISDVIAADIQRVIICLKDEGYSAKVAKTTKCVANMIMNYAITRDPPLIRFNPVSAVTIPKGLPKAKRSAPEEDVRKIIDANVRTAYFGLFPYFLVYSGCRKGEALALTWDDIDFKTKTITISKSYTFPNGMPHLKEPKTEAGIRDIPLFPQLETELLHVKPNKPKPGTLIFGMEDNTPMQENAYNRHWVHWAKDVGLAVDDPKKTKGKNGRYYTKHNWKATVTAHQLRHLFVTLCFEAGVDAETTKTWAGHADIQTTLQIYTDLRKRHETSQRDKMHQYLAKIGAGVTAGVSKSATPHEI